MITTEEIFTAEKTFPESIFDVETLQRVAGRFKIDDEYYTMTRRNPIVLTDDEREGIRRDNVKQFDFMLVVMYYMTMTPFDANLLGVRLPLKVLAEITGMSTPEAASLKRLCNVMRLMSQEEYDDRIAKLAPAQTDPVEETPDEDAAAAGIDMDKVAEALRPYMNQKRVGNLPKNLIHDFLHAPKYLVRRIWSGPNFSTAYGKACKMYSK